MTWCATTTKNTKRTDGDSICASFLDNRNTLKGTATRRDYRRDSSLGLGGDPGPSFYLAGRFRWRGNYPNRIVVSSRKGIQETQA